MKQYSQIKGQGDRGEAIFEALINEYAAPHKISASKDIGVDYICEWKNNEKPTGVMFTVQVKYYLSHKANFIDKDRRLNLLKRYTISPTISIDQQTQEYWKLLAMPSYIFIITKKDHSINVFYKRYTPIITAKASQSRSPFYKVNDGFDFLAFADNKEKIGGFARDLYIDQMRSNYSKGLIAYLNPRRLGLKQFPDQDKDVFFKDIFKEYKNNFEQTFTQLRSIMKSNIGAQATPSEAPPDED